MEIEIDELIQHSHLRRNLDSNSNLSLSVKVYADEYELKTQLPVSCVLRKRQQCHRRPRRRCRSLVRNQGRRIKAERSLPLPKFL